MRFEPSLRVVVVVVAIITPTKITRTQLKKDQHPTTVRTSHWSLTSPTTASGHAPCTTKPLPFPPLPAPAAAAAAA